MVATVLHGVGVGTGRVSGPVWRIPEPADRPAGPGDPGGPGGPGAVRLPVAAREKEAGRLGPAAELVASRLREQAGAADGAAAEVLATTAAMAVDPGLLGAARAAVRDDGLPATEAVRVAAATIAAQLRELGGYLAERVTDVHDVRDRLIAELSGQAPRAVPVPDRPSVLVAADLAPADTAVLPPALVLALVVEHGGPTSHTAVLARELGIPAVVGCAGAAGLAPGSEVTVDAAAGTVTPGTLAPRAAATQPDIGRPAGSLRQTTADGHRVALLANLGGPADRLAVAARAAAAAGAAGVGLLRTEAGYLAAATEPGPGEQAAALRAVFDAFTGRPVVVRTLDAGADKPLPFLPAGPGQEPNPALGVRGLRMSRRHTGVLDRQLAAIAAAAGRSGARVSVMAPMVATAEETAWFVARARAAGIARAGVMIEIPAAVLSAVEILAEADFASVGTNDLAQYTFAADRQVADLAALNDPWQPALLRLLRQLGQAAGAAGTPMSVCGEAAADPALAPVLVGLGATGLSMAHPALPAVAAELAGVTLAECRTRAAAACAAADPEAARRAVRES